MTTSLIDDLRTMYTKALTIVKMRTIAAKGTHIDPKEVCAELQVLADLPRHLCARVVTEFWDE